MAPQKNRKLLPRTSVNFKQMFFSATLTHINDLENYLMSSRIVSNSNKRKRSREMILIKG